MVKHVNLLLSEITSTPTPTGIMILTNKHPRRVVVEIEYEEVRQKSFQDKPSRFNCLWAAENSKEGEILIEKMFPHDPNRKSFLVEILPDSKVHKADKRWYEKYYDNPDVGCIKNYWEGKPFNNNPRWEYLIDGGFKISNEDIILLREHSMRTHVHILGKDLVENIYKINPIKRD
ncbi:MAG: hypothetical protein JW873_00270 [Candidatus Saganbacteria bacterium]|nr:hypothetical protein [Candidatus Saganbacteria bacterium]